MEMKAGYKQAEVGAIPNDWEVEPLGRLVTSVEYGSSAKSSPKGVVPVLRMGNLQDGKIDWSDLVYTSDEMEISKYSLRQGDVLFNRTNTIDLVGKTSIYLGEQPAIFAGYLIRVNVIHDTLDSRYLNYILNTEFSKKYSLKVLSVAVGQANINGQKLKTYPIPIPPAKEEQSAIAEALGDVDALLSGLDKLIAKKRDLKQATMQQLLTGKTRLPGFGGEWKVRRLGEVADVKTGPFGSSLHERDYVLDGTPIITVEHLGERGVEHVNLPMVSDADCKRLSAYALEVGDIVFSRVGSVDRNALVRETEAGWLFSGRLLRVRPQRKLVHPMFLSYQFHSERFKQAVRNVAVGQTMASLNTKILNGLVVYLPTLAEQSAIADVLSDTDAELAALEARLDKTRLLKQGMMQELLTGKTRLV
jgi:type I restriction enzyme S subunit